MVWHKNKYEEHWNRIEDQVCLHTGIPTQFLTKVPKIYDGEKIAFSKNVAGKTGYLHAKLKLDACLSSYTDNNSKWTKDLNINLETLKLVQERAGNTL
jgi:uncharacterized membrane protein